MPLLRPLLSKLPLVLVGTVGITQLVAAADGFTDTPMLPGGQWHVHDPNRPLPPVVKPGATVGEAPSDAVVLFDGTDLSHWTGKDGEARWKIEDGVVVVPAGNKEAGVISTKEQFGDMQLHLEFATPNPPSGSGQGRGNSGIFLMGRYELQVLDSYESSTYADGQAAALYGMRPPLVNACRPPGEWQTYDIVFIVPRFDSDGKLLSPAYITVLHNGVLVQNHSAYLGPSGYRQLKEYAAHPPKGPITLQNHNNAVRYRNIWVREFDPSEGQQTGASLAPAE